ncbi:MAG: preprotein translocase subunit SecG [Gaiellaceae bacterium]|nr:preprotein translocase subunit SecG [Gaiellaceae bacterium]
MTIVLVGLQVLLAFGVIVLVLMHDGKDAGLSGAFGVAGGSAGTQVMQRNLTRLTIAIAVLFVLNSVLLGFRNDL